jgi:hypothetical protein
MRRYSPNPAASPHNHVDIDRIRHVRSHRWSCPGARLRQG